MNKFASNLTDAEFDAMPASERFVQVAAYYCDKVRVHEQPKGSNRGPEIDAWAREIHIGLGQPWCGTFVTHCLKESGYDGPLPDNPASTHAWAEWATAHGKLADHARRGDVFVLLFTATTGYMGVHLDDTGRTIEGNSNDDGGREGYEVVRHNRAVVPSPPKRIVVRLF